MQHEFLHLKSIRVIVEERRLGGIAHRGDWRIHEYSGLEAIPEPLRPAFASPGTNASLDLLELVRQAYASRRNECRFEAEYRDGAGCDKRTVLRTIFVHLNYQTSLRTEAWAPLAAEVLPCHLTASRSAA